MLESCYGSLINKMAKPNGLKGVEYGYVFECTETMNQCPFFTKNRILEVVLLATVENAAILSPY